MGNLRVEDWLDFWGETRGGQARLINVSENHTYLVEGPRGRAVLRVHRPGYQSRAAIESELAWLAALHDLLPVPYPLETRTGPLVQEVEPGRYAVLFVHEAGTMPTGGEDLVPLFRVLGRYAATAHEHVGRWTPPPGFQRPRLTAETLLSPNGLWGDWRVAPQVEGDVRRALDNLDRRLRTELSAYGEAADRFGLIHADMRLANVLVDGDRVTLIDFDDCGFGWFVYDLAAALSFIETSPQVPALISAWIDGYEAIRPLSAADMAMIRPMILFRRMVLLAWIGSHGETDLAREHADRFAVDTVELADRLLS